MKALTLIQPWATCIAHHGKRVENRTWRPPASLIGQRLAIHAGKKVDWGVYADLVADGVFGPDNAHHAGETALFSDGEWSFSEGNITTGAIVAVARLCEIFSVDGDGMVWHFGTRRRVSDLLGRWASGPYCWRLDNVIALDKPVVCRGAQGLWEVPADVLAQVLRQLTPTATLD